jgi:hypothetical protein
MKNEKLTFWITFAMGIIVFGMVAWLYFHGEKNFFALGGGCLLSLVLIFYKPSWTTGIKNAIVGIISKKK